MTVFGLHGRHGSGVTTIAVNLAVALVSQHGKRVALVDLDFDFPDVDVLMDLPSQPNVADLPAAEAIDQEVLESCLHRHESGLAVLSGASQRVNQREIDVSRVRRVIEVLSQSYDHVILNSYWHPQMTGMWTVALECADTQLLVAVPDARSVELAAQHAEFLNTQGLDTTDLRLVFNMTRLESNVHALGIEQALGHKAAAAIPYDRDIAVGGEVGRPFILSLPDSRATEILLRLARLVLGYPEDDVDISPPAEETKPGPSILQIDDLVQEAQKYVEVRLQEEGGDIRPAIVALNDVAEANPKNFAVIFVLGFYLKWSGEVARGVSLLRKASELRPSDPRPYYWAADAYWTAALGGEVQFGSQKWFSNMLLEDDQLRNEAPEALVEAAESLTEMPPEQEQYLNWISRRCRDELGIGGPGAASIALGLFDSALGKATNPDDAMHIRGRLATVRAFSRSRGWD